MVEGEEGALVAPGTGVSAGEGEAELDDVPAAEDGAGWLAADCAKQSGKRTRTRQSSFGSIR